MLRSMRSISRTLRPLQPSHARLFTTVPRDLPTYLSSWNPTLLKKDEIRSNEVLDKIRKVHPSAKRDEERRAKRIVVRRAERAQLCQQAKQKGLVVVSEGHHEARSDLIRLNFLLKTAETEPNRPYLALKICETYLRLRDRYREAVRVIPDNVWDILWKMHKRQADIEGRPWRLRLLHEDIAQCGRYEPVGHRIQHLETLLHDGHEEQALKEWEEDSQGANKLSRHDYKPEHLELGARMHALRGNLDTACRIMEELFDLYPTWDPSVMITVFRAHTNTDSVRRHYQALPIYQAWKQRSNKDATLEDYDAFLIGFIEARAAALSRRVFEDMVKEGYLATASTPLEVEKVLKRLHKLYLACTSVDDKAITGLEAIHLLPPSYDHHLFIHWMRNALDEENPEGAIQLLELMFTRGLQPEPIHFNLLLKALMRTGEVSHILKAENIGWQMINKAQVGPEENVIHLPLTSESKNEQEAVPKDAVTKKIVQANITTFAIMIKHHADKSQWEYVDYLERRMIEWGFEPNSEVMNRLIDAKCLQGKYSQAWKLYKSLTDVPADTPGVFPDGASIRSIWKMLRAALADPESRYDLELPSPRELLAETVQWIMLVRSRPDVDRFRIGAAGTLDALSKLMMHCFSYSKDLPGSLVALHVLHKKFDLLPHEDAHLSIKQHAAWTDLEGRTQQERGYFHSTDTFGKHLDVLDRVYMVLLNRRTQEIDEEEWDWDDRKRREILLNVLSEFVRVLMKRTQTPEAVEGAINQVKAQVGVSDMSTGDMDAFQVA